MKTTAINSYSDLLKWWGEQPEEKYVPVKAITELLGSSNFNLTESEKLEILKGLISPYVNREVTIW